MRYFALALSIILFAGHGHAQTTKFINRDSIGLRQRFEVLKSNPLVRQGKYTLMALSSHKIFTTGFYKNNQRDSIWREYDRDDHVIVEGKYKDGQKYGIWNYYGDRWVLNNTYDFNAHRLTYHLFTKEDSIRKYPVIIGKDTVARIMSRPPIYRAGDVIMYRSLIYNLQYPKAAREHGRTGRVEVTFTVDEQGRTRNYKVVHPLGYGLDEEAIRVIKNIPPDWVPGLLNGKPVPVIMKIPVAFSLGK